MGDDVVKSVVDEAVSSHAPDLTEEQRAKLHNIGVKIFEGGMIPKDAMQLSDETVEAMYAHGYRLYQGAKYGDAGHIFRMLAVLDPTQSKYYLGMGACLHRLKQYEPATFMYELAAALDKTDPMPLYYASDCRTNMGHEQIAMDHLKNVIERSKGREEYALIADRAKMTLDSLKKEESKKGG